MTMFRKLQVQLTAVCAAVTSLVLLAMAAASLHFSAGQLVGQYDARFDSTLNSIFYVLQTQPVIHHRWLLETEASEGVMIRIQSRDHQTQFTRNSPLRDELTAKAYDVAVATYGFDPLTKPKSRFDPETIRFTLRTDQGEFRASVTKLFLEEHWASVVVLKSMAGEQRQVRRLFWWYGLCALGAILCLLVFSWFFTGRVIGPIRESKRRQTEFVAAASHELRAPLAVMQVSAESIQNADLASAKRYGEILVEECLRLSRLTDDLLGLASADSRSWSLHIAAINPDVLVLNAVEAYEGSASAKGILLTAELPQASLPSIDCDSQRIQQALAVLLDNAIRYTPANGRVVVSADRSRGMLRLTVADSGPGIPAEQRPLIFDRFYRGDAARSDREHYGLGLSIAKEIAERHKGRITVGESQLGGAEFSICLPIPAR